jgi:hypothetical protein
MKLFLVHSGLPCCPSLLTLEGKLLLPGINDKDDEHHSVVTTKKISMPIG